jgi:hypothetical protein
MADGPDESNLEDNFSMAQVFDIPTGNPIATSECLK